MIKCKRGILGSVLAVGLIVSGALAFSPMVSHATDVGDSETIYYENGVPTKTVTTTNGVTTTTVNKNTAKPKDPNDPDTLIKKIKSDYKKFKKQKINKKKITMLNNMYSEYKAYSKKSDANIAVKNQYLKDLKYEKEYFVKRNKRDLKYMTLNKKDFKRAWSDVLEYMVKYLGVMKINIKKEKGIVYTTKQYNSLYKKLNKLQKKYTKRDKIMKHKYLYNNFARFLPEPIDFNDAKNNSFSLMKEKPMMKKNNKLMIGCYWRMDEEKGKISIHHPKDVAVYDTTH